MKTEKELLIENIKEYAIILDDYIIEITNELGNIILEENK